MLTGLAILERELGLVEYARQQVTRRLAGRLGKAEADRLREELAELEHRKAVTLRLLEQRYEAYEERAGAEG